MYNGHMKRKIFRFFSMRAQAVFARFPSVARVLKSTFVLPLKRNKAQLDIIAEILNQIKTRSLLYVDVGCYDGGFFKTFYQNILPTKSILAIGIDPIRYNHPIPFSVFLQAAISNGEEGYHDFYIYNDPQCNSLQKMRVENVTHLSD